MGALGRRHRVELGLFSKDRHWLMGDLQELPEPVLAAFTKERQRRPRPLRVKEGSRQPRLRGHELLWGEALSTSTRNELSGVDLLKPVTTASYPVFFLEEEGSQHRWAGVRLPTRGASSLGTSVLLIIKSNLGGGGLFFDHRLCAMAICGATVGSVLLWLPLIVNISRRLRNLLATTDKIAEGDLAIRVPSNWSESDELAKLGISVNRMANRLEGYVEGQKRFLGDIAHELSSPIARMQAAMGLVEISDQYQNNDYVRKLDDQLQHMGRLVNELLLFSKAGLQESPMLEPLALEPLIRRAVDREATKSSQVSINVMPNAIVQGIEDLLERAVANVIRNSVYYAGPNATIRIDSECESPSWVILKIIDDGPGVPEEALPQIFDAFYRLIPAGETKSSGTGLGLAIVKSCIEACQGSVSARNRKPNGLEVAFRLKTAPQDACA